MNEYIDFYILECLQIAKNRNDKSEQIILNNIKDINYEDAVTLAKSIVINDKDKPVLLLSEEEFINSIDLKKYLGELDAKKLWKLCVLLYAMVAKEIVAVTKLTSLDEYMKLYVDFKRGLDITSITVNGVMNERGKTYNITSEALVADMCKILCNLKYGLAISTFNSDRGYNINNEGIYNYSYGIDSLITIDTLENKRNISYRFALELKAFIKGYLNTELKHKHKMLILEILYLFGQFKNNPPSNDDNYRKLMSDGENKFKSQMSNRSLIELDGNILPLTILVNPESIRIREEFRQLIKEEKCEI